LDLNDEFVKKLWTRACDGRLQFNTKNLYQLALFYAAAQIEGWNGNGNGNGVEEAPKELIEKMEAKLAEGDVTVSQAHKEVSKCLTRMGIEHEIEVSPFERRGGVGEGGEGGGNFTTGVMMNIDIVIKNKEEKEKKEVAIEFNGPSHYVRYKGGYVLCGSTLFKRRLLEKLGFEVIFVGWEDWSSALRRGQQEDFLLRLIFGERMGMEREGLEG